MFEKNGEFTYLNISMNSGNEGNVYGDDNETWKLDGDKITILFNDGYRILSGTINREGDIMSGTSINKEGLVSNWYGELIKL